MGSALFSIPAFGMQNVTPGQNLYHAMVNDDNATINQLISTPGIDLNQQEPSSFLFMAISRGNVGLVKKLLDAGANPDLQTRVNGYTPLMYAVDESYYKNRPENTEAIIKLLVSKGANPNIRNNVGESAADLARNTAYRNALAQ